MPTAVRTASAEDLEAIRDIALDRGQPPGDSAADPAYVAHLRAHGVLLVAAGDDAVVGFGATRDVGDRTLLTDLFVAADAEGRGVGRAILAELWTEQARERITFSSQHERALPLYARFGLAPLWPLVYLEGSPKRLERHGGVERVSASEAGAVEHALTGDDRRADFEYWSRRATATCFVVEAGGRAVAAGVATDTELVHLACPAGADAESALLAALTVCAGDEVTLAVPGPHPAFGTLVAAGFAITDYDIHMATPGAAAAETFVYSPGLA